MTRVITGLRTEINIAHNHISVYSRRQRSRAVANFIVPYWGIKSTMKYAIVNFIPPVRDNEFLGLRILTGLKDEGIVQVCL
jgi:hypothetical protein